MVRIFKFHYRFGKKLNQRWCAEIAKGTKERVSINQEMATTLAKKGWRWSAHTHPDGSLRSLAEDRLILSEFGNKQSAILTSEGMWKLFDQNSDLINSSWLP